MAWMRVLTRGAAALAMVAVVTGAGAQNYPNRPIRMVVPFPPGGAVDVIGRVVAPALSERLGQPLVIDNRGGANAIIGTDIVAKAAPDGYTLLIVPAGHAITPNVSRKLPYDTLKDLAAVGLVGNGAYVLVVHPGLPAKSVSEFVAHAKARPGKLNYAATGYGNATHLAGELFKVLTGVDMVYILYKGGGPALTDVISGQVSAFFAGVASSAAHIRSGKVRALGVTTVRRAAALPDIPTIAEAGVPGYEVDGWYGILAPARTPAAILQRLNADINAVVATQDAKERLLAVGLQARGTTPAEFHQMIVKDIARWATVAKKAKLEPQ